MTEVRPHDGESIDSLLKRFSKKVDAAGIIQEVRARQEYVKPSELRRKEKAAGRARLRKQQRKNQIQIDFENENKFRPRRPRPPEGQQQDRRPPHHHGQTNQDPNGQKKPYYNRDNRNQQPRPQEKKPVVNQVTAESLKSLQEKFNSSKS